MTEPPAVVSPADASPDLPGTGLPAGFQVKLTNFSGPFDLLLELIGKHKLDVTEVALHTVTDDFIAYIRAMGDAWDLDETSEFLVIAATLLDLKAARLLPSASVEDEEDLALLEARDLLFARLLQYKAFKEAAAHIAGLEAIGSRRYPRSVSLEPQYAEALPDLVLGVGPERLLKLALKALTPRPLPVVSIAHIHQVRVSVREHAGILRVRLLELRVATFEALCADVETTLEVVARFLALLELYRENLVGFDQVQALEELTVRWIGSDDAGETIEVEEYEGAAEPSPSGPGSVVDADLLTGDDPDAEDDLDEADFRSRMAELAMDTDAEDDDADPDFRDGEGDLEADDRLVDDVVSSGSVESSGSLAGDGDESSDSVAGDGDVGAVGDEYVAVGYLAVVGGDGEASADEVDFGVGQHGGDDADADGNSDPEQDVSAAGLSEVGSGDLGSGDLGADDRRPGGPEDPDE